MAATCGAVGLAHDHLHVQLRLSLVVTRYIAHERQQLDLFMNCNSFVLFRRRLEVTQGHPFEAAASGEMSRGDLVISRELQQSRNGFVPLVKQ